MTDLDLTLTPAQWEHWDRHGWTLTVAPTEPSTDPTSAMLRAEHAHGRSLSSIARACGITRERVRQLVTATAPVPATVPCPDDPPWTKGKAGQCPTCSGSGVVPRTVGITRAEGRCECAEHGRWNGERYTGMRVNTRACPWHKTGGVIPAERVGTATVTAVPVVDLDGEEIEGVALAVTESNAWLVDPDVEQDRLVTHLFPTPPEPGDTVWRLDRNEER